MAVSFYSYLTVSCKGKDDFDESLLFVMELNQSLFNIREFYYAKMIIVRSFTSEFSGFLSYLSSKE